LRITNVSRKEKEFYKAHETPEEKRARRLAKKVCLRFLVHISSKRMKLILFCDSRKQRREKEEKKWAGMMNMK
jgi:hypothetical protein